MTIEVEVGNIVQVVDDRNLVVIDQGNTVEVAAVGAQGPTGPTGATGPQGPTGPAGPGVPQGGTTGQALVKTSATDYATAWENDILWPTLASTNIIGHPSRTFSAVPTLNQLQLVPFIIESPVTLDGIGYYQWNTNSTATARIRLGIYAADTLKRPRTLVVDAGTLTPGTNDTFQFISINQTLTRGLYYTAFVTQVANMNGSVGVGEAFGAWIRASYATTSLESWNGVAHNYIISNVTGALSATLGTASSNMNQAAKVFLRVA